MDATMPFLSGVSVKAQTSKKKFWESQMENEK